MIRLAAVDDSALIRGFLEGVLGSEPDFELLALGSNGAEAIDIVRHHQPDVLVLDLEMPGMGGLDVLRTLMVESPLRVLVYTSHQGKSLAAYQALRLGAVEFLNKPEDIIDPVKYDTARVKLVERIRAVAAIEFTIHKPDPTVAPRNQRPTECPFDA
ncbi:MAG: response regulator, partial [Candidatus Riflebacteria bacterium]|nr:response regulator [Candidatus Riflebacteria bacterium]